MRTNFLSILFLFSYMFHVTSSVVITDNLRTHKFVFMPENWLTVPILTFSSWNTYDQISFLTSKNNCDNTTRTRAFYIQYETGEEKKENLIFSTYLQTRRNLKRQNCCCKHELNLKITQRLNELEFSLKWNQPPRGVFKKGILKNLTNP